MPAVMRLANRDQPVSKAVPRKVREPRLRHIRKAPDAARARRQIHRVHILIGVVDKEQRAARHEKLAAAIFVHAGARGVRRGQQLAHATLLGPAHHRRAALLRRPSLQ